MATNYSQVTPGQPVSYSAQRENDITALLNSMNGMRSDASLGGAGSLSRLKVYNNTQESIETGSAVVFDEEAEIIDEAIACTEYKAGKKWGVLVDDLDPDSFGVVVISGPVEVEISSGSGQFATPASDGKSFVLGGSGVPVLCSNAQSAVILLGGSGGNQMLVELTSVPPQGFGNGKAKQIVGYTEKGEYIYSETEIPVRIPRL